MYEIDGIDFWDGANGGQMRKALAKLDPPHVMVNYKTHSNQPLPAKHDPGPYALWWDCGGSPMTFLQGDLAETGDYVTSDRAYLDHVIGSCEGHGVDHVRFSLRDYPCEESVLTAHGRTVRDHQRMTTERHRALMDLLDGRNADVEPVAVVQGWHTEDYLRHLDDLEDHGLLTDTVAIGSICAREDTERVVRIITRVREALPDRVGLHGFGIKAGVLRYREALDALESADSDAPDYAVSKGLKDRTPEDPFTWKLATRAYVNWRWSLKERAGTESLSGYRMEQQKLTAHQ